MIYELNVSTPLLLRQAVFINIKIETVVQKLLIVDEMDSSPKIATAASTLALRQAAVVNYSVYNGSVASNLLLQQEAYPRVFVVSAVNYFNIAHQVAKPFYEVVTSTLNLSQDLVKNETQYPSNTLSFTQTAHGALVRIVSVSHTLGLIGTAGVFKRATDFVMLSSPAPTPPVTLSVKFSFGGIDLVLPRPEPSNGLRFDFTRINRRTRGGDLVVYAATQWPKTKTLSLTFVLYGESKTQKVKEFLKNSLGKKVEYEDHYGNTWEGYIMTPDAQIVSDDRFRKSINLEFQGDKI